MPLVASALTLVLFSVNSLILRKLDCGTLSPSYRRNSGVDRLGNLPVVMKLVMVRIQRLSFFHCATLCGDVCAIDISLN